MARTLVVYESWTYAMTINHDSLNFDRNWTRKKKYERETIAGYDFL